ncbi:MULTISPECIES: hypothetical protein [unclassified Streptomyces]|uniref:hypothetical protein n=1 Tax=unclassified Streptomyces TaxID=2593676 RepID=UPI0035D6F14C
MSILIRLTCPSTTPEFQGGEAGDNGVDVAFEGLGESLEAGQACSRGGFDPCRQLVSSQLREHVGEGAHEPGECLHFEAVGQYALAQEPVTLGQSVKASEDQAENGASGWRPTADDRTRSDRRQAGSLRPAPRVQR